MAPDSVLDMDRWSTDQVVALAPDASSLTAGRKLSTASSWSGTGVDAGRLVVWGACRGSGKNPYRTAVDLSGPAYKCSCPSRKIPCKHALGLLLLWADGHVAETPAEGFAAEWMDGRTERAEKTAAKVAARASGTDEPSAASTRRTRARRHRVEAGLEDLDLWLTDQVRTGLARFEASGPAPLEETAARMVDAQAPGVATRLRSMTTAGEGWQGRVLEEFALLRLLVSAHRRLETLPTPLAATVRARIGYPTTREEVLAEPAVRDTWYVAALRDSDEENLTTRRVWLCGTSGRIATVVTFSAPGQFPDASLMPGMTIDADLHFHPGTHPDRAMVGTVHAMDRSSGALTTTTLTTLTDPARVVGLAEAFDLHADAVGADPWTTSVPVLLSGAGPVVADTEWFLRDASGHGVPWRTSWDEAAPGTRTLAALAVHGDTPMPMLVDVGAREVRALALLTPNGAIEL